MASSGLCVCHARDHSLICAYTRVYSTINRGMLNIRTFRFQHFTFSHDSNPQRSNALILNVQPCSCGHKKYIFALWIRKISHNFCNVIYCHTCDHVDASRLSPTKILEGVLYPSVHSHLVQAMGGLLPQCPRSLGTTAQIPE